MSDQVQRPMSDEDREGWIAYWAAQGMAWRTEPEIDGERQRFLAERRAITPDLDKGVYPFTDIRLERADVEWLLATHESDEMRGPVDWGDERQRRRTGVDLRGADLRRSDLQGLPLARMTGGLIPLGGLAAFERHLDMAAVHLEQADMRGVQLQGAVLGGAHLEQASLYLASLERAHLEQAHLQRASLHQANLTQVQLHQALLHGTRLMRAHLEGAVLREAQLQGAKLDRAVVKGADLCRATLDAATALDGVTIGDSRCGIVTTADVRWGGANLAVCDWGQVRMLGDECIARSRKTRNGERKSSAARLTEYTSAVRANRQLSTVLRDQGLHEQASYFAYRALRLQRIVWWRQGRPLRFFGSLFLDLISGYGYRPLRSFATYVLVVLGFAGAYLLNAQFAAPHLRWDEAIVLSISAFHGRGFFTSGISLGDTLARLAAGEAIIGLLIEITFIATFTQRFFAR